jgi:t-SNARE complex subunit (syntaxin)
VEIEIHLADEAGLHQHKAMAHKRKPSPHQKQVRFFIVLFIIIIVLVTALIVCFADRQNFSIH